MMKSYLNKETFEKHISVTLNGIGLDNSSTITEFDKVDILGH